MSRMQEYWLAVGSVSDEARKILEEADCIVHQVSAAPPVVLVGLRSLGGNAEERDLEIWEHGEIQIKSKNICLRYDDPYNSIIDATITTFADKQGRVECGDVRLTRWQDCLVEPDDDPF